MSGIFVTCGKFGSDLIPGFVTCIVWNKTQLSSDRQMN